MIHIEKERVLITPADIKPISDKFEVIGTFNPGAARLKNGKIVLYVRVCERLIKTEDGKYFYAPRFTGKKTLKIKIDKFKKELVQEHSEIDITFKDGTKRLTFISHLRRAILDREGFKVLKIDKKPFFYGLVGDGELGIEDPRITKIDNLYVMTYVSLSREENISTSYAISHDGLNWHRRGIIFGEQNKDVVIFPEKIKNKYVAFERPEGNFEFTPPHIWICYSKDLEFWGKPTSLFFSKRGEWDYLRAGAGCPPIKTEKGWLLIYHGVLNRKHIKKYIPNNFIDSLKHFFKPEEKEIESIYCAGAALFDLHNPKKLIAKTPHPIIIPKKKYEKLIYENKRVIFPTGLVQDNDKDYILLYSGAGDSVVTVKKIKLEEIMNKLEKV